MNTKSFISGLLAAYGLILLFYSFNISLLISLPIIAFGVNIGSIILSIVVLAIAYYMVH